MVGLGRLASSVKGLLWLIRGNGLRGQLQQLQAQIAQAADQTNLVVTHLRSQALVRGHWMHLDPTDSVVSPTLRHFGVFEPFETQLVQKIVRPGDVVLDVGANIGYYTLIFAELVGEQGHVYAFEPDPRNFAFLAKNVHSNRYRNVTLVQKAVADRTGPLKLYASPDNKGDHRIYDSGDGRPTVDIEAVALNDYFADYRGRIDFIKMDIQGAEAAALRGMTRLLNSHADVQLIAEFWPIGLQRFGVNPERFLEELRQLGFQWSVIDEESQTLQAAPLADLMMTYTAARENFTNLLCFRETRRRSGRPSNQLHLATSGEPEA